MSCCCKKDDAKKDSIRIVIAIGGNSLILDDKHVTIKSQFEAAVETAKHIARLIKEGNRVVIAHGNGPQVGFILRRSEIAATELHSVPLDSCVADTQGSIGYQLQMALDNELNKLGVHDVDVATVVTQVVVDGDDPAFKNPTKPVGSFMTKEEADSRIKNDGWNVKEDAGRGYRRVVASPKPKAILELNSVKKLLDAGIVTIAAGGGGIPVVKNSDGSITGKEAVIDKDLAAALMAKDLKADLFVISTAVPKVCVNFGKPDQKAIDKMTTEDAKKYIDEKQFAPGSMLPKVQAMIDFVETTGNVGLITDPSNIYDALYGSAGTKIVK